MVCINDLDEEREGGRKLEGEGREIEKAEFVPRVYEASIPRRHAPRCSIFNELSLSLDYRTRGFDVVMGSNESIDNVDELMTLVIQRQSSSPTLRYRLAACLRILPIVLSASFSTFHIRGQCLSCLLFLSLSLCLFFFNHEDFFLSKRKM